MKVKMIVFDDEETAVYEESFSCDLSLYDYGLGMLEQLFSRAFGQMFRCVVCEKDLSIDSTDELMDDCCFECVEKEAEKTKVPHVEECHGKSVHLNP